MTEEKCAVCGTVLNIRGCLNCGAPVCCQKCCELEHQLAKKDAELQSSNARLHEVAVHCSTVEQQLAAMRCYVASKLGFEIEIPEELNP